MTEAFTIPLHSDEPAGINAFDINKQNRNLVATGGYDGKVNIVDIEKKQVLITIEHPGSLSPIMLSTNTIFISSSDGTSSVWRYNLEKNET